MKTSTINGVSATATLYNDPSRDAVAQYKQLRSLAQSLPLPAVTRLSIDVDYADALFFAGDPLKSDQDSIIEAIAVAEAAVMADLSDKKQQRWHWTLGWAYYELSHFTDRIGNCEAALKHLETFKWPHDLIRKNLIAAYVGAGRMIDANRNAVEFIANNDGYTVAVEERWPYREGLAAPKVAEGFERWWAWLGGGSTGGEKATKVTSLNAWPSPACASPWRGSRRISCPRA